MRLTTTLNRQNLTRMWKRLWKSRGKFHITPLRLPSDIQQMKFDIVKPGKSEGRRRRSNWVAPVEGDVRHWKPIPVKERINYNDDPANIVTPRTRLLQGLQQACVLAKAKQINGFPTSIQNLVGAVEIPNQDMLVQRCIMQSQVWDPTMDKLPKRIDKRKVGWHFQREYGIKNERSSTILLRNLIRLCQSQAGTFPSIITDRRLIYKPYIGTNYYFQNNFIIIQGLYEYLLSGSEGLGPFADEEEVDSTTTFTLPDIYPVSPLIDLLQDHCYTVDTTPSVQQSHSHSIPQTIFMLNKNYWSSNQRQARCLLFCLATALAQARKMYGPDVRQLPSPVSVQCVNMDPTTLNFIFFQLNTADFTSSDGLKNMAWFSNNNQLFNKKLSEPWLGRDHRKTEYNNYDPKVFRRLLAVMLNGVPEVQGHLRKIAEENVSRVEESL